MLTLVALLTILSGCGDTNGADNISDGGEAPLEETSDPVEEPQLVEGWEMVSSSEQHISTDTVKDRLNINEEVSLEALETFLTSYATQLKEEYPDHRIIVEAYQDGELVAEKELE